MRTPGARAAAPGAVARRSAGRLVALALWLLPAGAAWADADIENGRTLAQKHCALCHVIGDFNRFGGIGSTPSFQLLAGMADGAERFQGFYARRPHPSFVLLPDQQPPTGLPLNAPPVRLSHAQVEDIAAFALTLRDPRLSE